MTRDPDRTTAAPPPDLGPALAQLSSLPPAAAADAARADQDRRWAAGERVPAEAYLAALPHVAADPEHALVLIYGEVLARTAAGETPGLTEYAARFPHLADRLAVQFDLHAALAAASTNASRTGAFTPTPADDTTGPDPTGPTPAAPDRVGGYEVLGELGRGGMGRVLAARDPVLGREVAIKILLAGRATSDAARRFVRESRITARLPHPGVPPVHELGQLPDGSPFLAMKLVRGRTLDRMLRDRPAPSADLPRFAQVFEQVCQAVGFAHAQGIVHRDLKPANVMVGEFGEVQVMDWGLAKDLASGGRESDVDPPVSASHAPHETTAGSIMGTPAYMAPEQARGEPAAARADVFALGAVLAEILTGTPAFTGPSVMAVLKMAAAGDVAGVFDRLDACGADPELTDLARRCLSPAAADRPADGKAVADAVAAHRAGVEERLRAAEQARAADAAREAEGRKRRKVQAALAAAVGLLVAAAGGFAWWQDRQGQTARRKQAEFDLAEARADADRREADRRTRDGVEAALARLPDLQARGLWDSAGEALGQADKLLGADGPADLRANVVAARAGHDLAARLDRVRQEQVFVLTGALAPAAYRAAYAAAFKDHGFDVLGGDRVAVAAAVADHPRRDDLLAALDDWAHWEPDKDTSVRVLGVAKRAAGKSWRDRVGTRVGFDSRADFHRQFPPAEQTPTLYRVLARAASASGRDGTYILHDALLRHPGDFWLLYDLAMTYEGQKKWKLAAEAWRAARAARPAAWMAVNELGVVLREAGDLEAAADCFREAVRLKPTAHSHSNLGNVLRDLKDLKGSLAAHREAVRCDPAYANARNNLGTALRDAGEVDAAVAEFRAAIALDPADPAPRYNLGLALLTGKDDPKAAAAEFRDIFRRKPEIAGEERVRLHSTLAKALDQLDDPGGAVAAYREVVRDHPADAEARYMLADMLCKAGRNRAAIPEYRKAIELNDEVPKYHTDLGVELRGQGDVAGAIKAHRAAVRLDPKFTMAHVNLGSAYLHARDFDAAEAAFRKAVSLDPEMSVAHFNLGLALAKKKDYDGAERSLRRAVRLDPDRVGKPARQLLDAIAADRAAAAPRREVAPPPRPARP